MAIPANGVFKHSRVRKNIQSRMNGVYRLIEVEVHCCVSIRDQDNIVKKKREKCRGM